MPKNIGKSINSTDVANVNSAISVDSITSVTLLPGQSGVFEHRINVVITNWGNKTLWIKEQAASVDDDKKGIPVAPGGSLTVVRDGTYSGEISGIMDSGGTKEVFVMWK